MSLLDVIKKTAIDAINATNPVNVLYGEVTSTKPLKIQVRQKLTLTSEFLVLCKNVTDFEVDMTADHAQDRKKFTVHNALKTGEKVIMLRVQGGHKFVVIDRI